jgi:signal transduction histidine kinase
MAKGLAPVEVDADGLMLALNDLAAKTCERHAVECDFQCDEPVCVPDNQAATHLYRMCQEAVTNAVRHGGAKKILIRLSEDENMITLEIQDDGCGFPSAGPADTGAGLRIMNYRAELIGAKLTVGSASPTGARVVCDFPKPKAKPLMENAGAPWDLVSEG